MQVVLLQEVEVAIWRGTKLNCAAIAVSTSGWTSLDAELPGGGWSLRALQCEPAWLTAHRDGERGLLNPPAEVAN